MSNKEKQLIKDFCKENLHAHTDWTGIYVETIYQCPTIDIFVEDLLNYIEEHE